MLCFETHQWCSDTHVSYPCGWSADVPLLIYTHVPNGSMWPFSLGVWELKTPANCNLSESALKLEVWPCVHEGDWIEILKGDTVFIAIQLTKVNSGEVSRCKIVIKRVDNWLWINLIAINSRKHNSEFLARPHPPLTRRPALRVCCIGKIIMVHLFMSHIITK